MGAKIPDLHYLQVFRLVLPTYQEKRLASGRGIEALNYGAGAEDGKVTNTGRKYLVKPTESDFLCDVEISARHALSPAELLYFNSYYKTSKVVVYTEEDITEEGQDTALLMHLESFPEYIRNRVAIVDHRMRVKLAKRLVKVKVYPHKLYLGARDVSETFSGEDGREKFRRRQMKKIWSHLY